MKFNSILFLLFFPIVAGLFFILPHRWRWILLLVASYLFYLSWNPKYIIVLLAVTGISYLAGLWLNREGSPLARRLILIFSLAASLGILFFFKLANFILPSISGTMELWGRMPQSIVIPLGLSFYTLQTMSYIIDVYRGTVKAEKRAGIFSLFVAFFPQLPAGPIGRAKHLLPQYDREHTPDYEGIVTGLQRIVWGLFKKLVIADRLSPLVDTVYGNPTGYTGLALILATYAFAFQIYCDFSGYADIAVGVARVMGFQLTENFQQPYYAQSIADFWRRWHISLSTWLRDYIFYPMQRALRRSQSSGQLPTLILPPMVTMLASGLWHGEGWTFLLWGALHGLYMVVAVLWGQAKKSIQYSLPLPSRLSAGLRMFATFNLVSFAWIFFRANSVSDAIYIIGHLFENWQVPSSLVGLLPGGAYEWMIAILAILIMEAVHILQMKRGSLRQVVRFQPAWVRWSLYFGLVMIIFMFGTFASTEFIYSRF